MHDNELSIAARLREKPRRFHIGLALMSAWLPTGFFWFGHVALATVILVTTTALFFYIHPMTLRWETKAMSARDRDFTHRT